jgi:hypothetical protein
MYEAQFIYILIQQYKVYNINAQSYHDTSRQKMKTSNKIIIKKQDGFYFNDCNFSIN